MPPKDDKAAGAAVDHDPETGEVKEENKPGTDMAKTGAGAGNAMTIPEDMDYGADMGAGFENQTSEDVSVPFLEVLQPGSPEVQGEDATARPGMIINRTTGDVYSGKEGISFVPAYTEHVIVEWVPRDNGGGLVGTHQLDSPLSKNVRETQPLGKYKHPENGNDLIETFYVYGVAIGEDGAPFPAVIAFSSTKIKPYKDWMFRARSIVISLPNGRKLTKLPLFSHGYQLRSVFIEKNGFKWYNWVIGFAGENADKSRLAPTDDRYLMARQVKEAVSAGTAKAATDTLKPEDRPDETPVKGDTKAADAPY